MCTCASRMVPNLKALNFQNPAHFHAHVDEEDRGRPAAPCLMLLLGLDPYLKFVVAVEDINGDGKIMGEPTWFQLTDMFVVPQVFCNLSIHPRVTACRQARARCSRAAHVGRGQAFVRRSHMGIRAAGGI